MKKHKNLITVLFIITAMLLTHCVSYADNSVMQDNFNLYSTDSDSEHSVFTGTVKHVYQAGELMTVEEQEAVLAAMADETKSAAIQAIYDGAMSYLNVTDTATENMMVDLADYSITPDELNVCFQALLNNYPDMYFVSREYKYTYFNNGLIDACYIYFDMTPTEAKETQTQIDNEVDNILPLMKEGMSRGDQIVVVNDYFAHHYTYDYEHYNNPDGYTRHYTIPALFIDKTAVCQGFGLAFQYVMQKLNIPCITVQSDEMNHLWNLVQAKEGSENWYHIDVTWNTQWVDAAPFTFFLKSDDSFKNLTVNDELYSHHDYTPDGMAVDTEYDDCAFSRASTTPIYGNGGWYYGKGPYDDLGDGVYSWTTANTIFKYNFLTNTVEPVVTVSDDWAYEGYEYKVYENYYFNSAWPYKDKIYYHDALNIYEFNPATGESKIYVASPHGAAQYKKSIYSMSLEGDTITYGIAGGYGDAFPQEYYTVEIADVSNTLDISNGELSSTLTDIAGATDMFCVFYDDDGRFISCTSKALDGESYASIEENVPSGSAEASVFAVKSTGSDMQPVGKSFHSSTTENTK